MLRPVIGRTSPEGEGCMDEGKVRLEWQHSADQKSVRIKFQEKDYSALDLEALIFGLAEIRDKTEPPIPTTLDPTTARQSMLRQPWYAGRDIDTDVITLACRCPGIGWMPFGLSVEEATRLRDMIDEQLEQPCKQRVAH
jgi:hypothetical protein